MAGVFKAPTFLEREKVQIIFAFMKTNIYMLCLRQLTSQIDTINAAFR